MFFLLSAVGRCVHNIAIGLKIGLDPICYDRNTYQKSLLLKGSQGMNQLRQGRGKFVVSSNPPIAQTDLALGTPVSEMLRGLSKLCRTHPRR